MLDTLLFKVYEFKKKTKLNKVNNFQPMMRIVTEVFLTMKVASAVILCHLTMGPYRTKTGTTVLKWKHDLEHGEIRTLKKVIQPVTPVLLHTLDPHPHGHHDLYLHSGPKKRTSSLITSGNLNWFLGLSKIQMRKRRCQGDQIFLWRIPRRVVELARSS